MLTAPPPPELHMHLHPLSSSSFSVVFHHNSPFSINLHSAPGKISTVVSNTAEQVTGSDSQLPLGTTHHHLYSRPFWSSWRPCTTQLLCVLLHVLDTPLGRKRCLPAQSKQHHHKLKWILKTKKPKAEIHHPGYLWECQSVSIQKLQNPSGNKRRTLSYCSPICFAKPAGKPTAFH